MATGGKLSPMPREFIEQVAPGSYNLTKEGRAFLQRVFDASAALGASNTLTGTNTFTGPVTIDTSASAVTPLTINQEAGEYGVKVGDADLPQVGYGFTNKVGTGWFYNGSYLGLGWNGNRIGYCNDPSRFWWDSSFGLLSSIGSLAWGDGDLKIARQGAGVLAQYDDGIASSQKYRIYNFQNSSFANYERVSSGWVSNVFTFSMEFAGTGVQRSFSFSYDVSVSGTFSSDSGTLTGASATPHTFNQTWNNGTTNFRCVTISATDTASAAGSWLLNLKTGANSVAHVDKVGLVAATANTAITAGGVQAIQIGSTAAMGVYFGSGAPSVSAAKGSLYLRSDGSATNNRMYVNTDGSTTWTAVTTAA